MRKYQLAMLANLMLTEGLALSQEFDRRAGKTLTEPRDPDVPVEDALPYYESRQVRRARQRRELRQWR